MTIVMEYVNIQLNEVVIQEASRLSAESRDYSIRTKVLLKQSIVQTASDFK
jgi:hypothetical protein